ncbi:MBL fold metallo-hydrolase [Emticicia sp. SJ17W-69]|uniref:MBL fold metallo-hydrolase n=1 Tax=Emticicia sp. SJ17W-69 TaxID=3421657 RepID=UPI003EBA70E1
MSLTLLTMWAAKNILGKKKKIPMVTSFTANPTLTTIKKVWKGTPIDQFGKFIYPENPTIISYSEVLKFMVQPNPQRAFKKQDSWRISVIKNGNWLNDSSDKIVWLGHASFFIQLNGIRILIDPMFYNLAVAKRYSELPIDPTKFHNINYILVSHAHYDHCDKKSIKLLTKNNPNAQILCGLNLEKLLRKWLPNKTQSAGWYQQYSTEKDLKITFVPSRHWANRSPFDVNNTLWGGFVIECSGKTIYFSGDSGYGSHYTEIAEVFPSIDIALIGAGAYAPTWFMGQHHQDPHQALQAFHDTKAKTFIPFHYGTFDSADEPMGEPEEILSQLNADGKINNQLRFLKLGETHLV